MKKYLVLDYGGSSVKISLMDENANRLYDTEKPAHTSSLDEMKSFAQALAERSGGIAAGNHRYRKRHCPYRKPVPL